jgi:hypothetical protein
LRTRKNQKAGSQPFGKASESMNFESIAEEMAFKPLSSICSKYKLELLNQVVAGNRRIDFVLQNKDIKFAVEVDGKEFHTLEGDFEKDTDLAYLGYTTIRIPAFIALYHPYTCKKYVEIRVLRYYHRCDRCGSHFFTPKNPESLGEFDKFEYNDNNECKDCIEKYKQRYDDLD